MIFLCCEAQKLPQLAFNVYFSHEHITSDVSVILPEPRLQTQLSAYRMFPLQTPTAVSLTPLYFYFSNPFHFIYTPFLSFALSLSKSPTSFASNAEYIKSQFPHLYIEHATSNTQLSGTQN